jgi:alpha-D-xyloside xylohydrolase
VDPVINHNWPEPPLVAMPAGLDKLNQFSARWQGELVAPESGDYEIGLEGDDGYRLWLDDKLVVEDWADAGARYKSTHLKLSQGQVLKLRIDYYQNGGGRLLRLAWRTPSQLRAQAAVQDQIDTRQATLLPAGGDWYDYWSGQRHAGGQTVTRPYGIDEFPLFVRAGAILPLGAAIEHVHDQPNAPYEIRIYPGADGHFTLYEDDGKSYRYEAGERATVQLHWDDKRRSLHIDTRQGSFPGMVAQRELRVRLMDGRGSSKTVLYRGQALTLNLR